MAKKRSKIISDADYKTRNKDEERKSGKNQGGFVDLTPKTTKARGK